MSRPLIIYHSPCADGFCAAWVTYRALRAEGMDPELFPARYGQAPPDVCGRCVCMVDFSYQLEVMQQIVKDADFVTCIDHHKTAEGVLVALQEGPSRVCVDFNTGHSGARLAWDHFQGPAEAPWLVDYVEDRDLWRHVLPDTKAVNAYISILPFDLLEWDRANQRGLVNAAAKGEVVLHKIEQTISAAAKTAVGASMADHHGIPVVNFNGCEMSELLARLLEMTPSAPFSVGWFVRSDGLFQYSLRSRGDFDVSELAKLWGGGGHKAAAGFEVPTPVHHW